MSEWLQIDQNRLTKILNNGKILIVKPANKDLIVPLFCPICNFPMRTLQDSIAFRDVETCHMCDLKWQRPYKEQWMNGWRPYEHALWNDYIKERDQQIKPRITFS
jgi:hypothetical protein